MFTVIRLYTHPLSATLLLYWAHSV
jgi:hypothetical protein